jgi:predicted DNA-binding protein YlxM (UPF0122 family)
MDKKLKLQIISAMRRCFSIAELADEFSMSRQAMHQKIEAWGLRSMWDKRLKATTKQRAKDLRERMAACGRAGTGDSKRRVRK